MSTETYSMPTSAAAHVTFATPTGTGHRGVPVPTQPAATTRTWSGRPSGGHPVARPTPSHPEPRLRQLVGVCGWAAVLGGIGLILGIRALVGEISGAAPGWYEPAMVITGLTGIGLTVAAFLSVQMVRRPWVLLGCASGALLLGMILTSLAF